MKPGDAEYDALVAKLQNHRADQADAIEKSRREREEGNKGMLDKNGDLIDSNAPKRTQYEATMVAMGAQETSQFVAPKRRGRPKGSKNRPKEVK